MSKISRRMRRRRAKKDKRPKVPPGARCFKRFGKDTHCGARAPAVMACEICAKKGKTFEVRTCATHCLEAREQLKSHILRKHPSTIPAWMLATLAGHDMR